MTTYSLKTKLTETGKLTLVNLPFQKGDEIEIMIMNNSSSENNLHSQTITNNQNYRYDDPFEPATPLEDWDVLK